MIRYLLSRYRAWKLRTWILDSYETAGNQCTCLSSTDRHDGQCDLVRAWLSGFGITDGRDPWTERRYKTVDLSHTRYARRDRV